MPSINWLNQCCIMRTVPNIFGFYGIATADLLPSQSFVPLNQVIHSIISSQYGIVSNANMLTSLETWNGCSILLFSTLRKQSNHKATTTATLTQFTFPNTNNILYRSSTSNLLVNHLLPASIVYSLNTHYIPQINSTLHIVLTTTMGFRKAFHSVARIFSTKDKKVAKQKNTTKSRKLTKSQYPSKTTNSTKKRVKNLVEFLTGSKSRRYSTESAPESETLVGSSNPSSTSNHRVETFEQVPDHAGAENTNRYQIEDGLTGPSSAQNVLPVSMATVVGNQFVEGVEDAELAALPSEPPTPAIKSVPDGALNDINDQSVEVVEAADPAIFDNDDVIDSQDPTVETVNNGADAAEYAAPIFNENTEDNVLAVVTTELSIDVPENFHLVFEPLATPNENGVLQVLSEPEVTEQIGSDTSTPGSIQMPSAEVSPSIEASIQSYEGSINNIDGSAIQDESITSNEEVGVFSEENPVAFPDHIDGYHLNGRFAPATTVPHKARSFCGRIFTAPQPEERAWNEDEYTEDVVRQRRNSAPGNLVSPDSHYPTRRRASLTPSDAENEAMFNDPNNYIDHDDSDMYIEPKLNIYPSVFVEPAVPMIDAPLNDPERGASLPISESEITYAHVVSPIASDSASGSLSPNEPDSLEQGAFMLELGGRFSLEHANRKTFLSELRNTFPVEQDSSDVVDEQTEEVIVPQKANQPCETHAEEIVRMYRIPRYSQFRSVFPPPGLSFPWGPHNPIPTRIDNFRGNDPWLPTPWTDPDAYHQLNGIQRRWVQLEVLYQTRLFWLDMNFKAVIHLEENLASKLYAFNNFCGWYGCQAEKCKHSKVDGRLFFFDLHSYYTSWKNLRDEQLLLDNEPSSDYAVHEPETNASTVEQTALHEQEARVQQAREQEASQVEPADDHYADLNSSLQFAQSVKLARREMMSLMDSEIAVVKVNSVVIQEVLARNEAQHVESKPPQLPNAQFDLALINTQAQPKQSRWAEVFKAQQENGCEKAEVSQDVVPNTSENPVPVGNFGLKMIDFSVLPKQSRFTEFFPTQPKSEPEAAQDSVVEKTPEDPAPQAHFGLQMIETSLQPRKSRFTSLFGAQTTTDQGIAPAQTSDSEESMEPLGSLGGNNKDQVSTRDTSVEPTQSLSFSLEAHAVSDIDLAYEEEEGDLYSASPLRGPSPASIMPNQSSPVPAPEEFMNSSLASKHHGSWQFYDDQGSLLDDHVENVGDFVIEDTMEGVGEDLAFVFGQVEFPIDSPHEESREMLDGEPWIIIRLEDSPGDIDFEEVPEGVELLQDFYEDGWPVDEGGEHDMTQTIREGLEEENPKVIKIVSDFEYYANSPDSGWEAPEDSDATESDSKDSDEDGGDTESDFESPDTDEDSDTAETKAWESNKKDNDPNPEAQELVTIDEDTEPKYQFSRTPIQARPALSGLALSFQEFTSREVGYHVNAHPGFTNDPDAFMDSEPLPIMQKDANMVHCSNIIRQINLARDELIDRWLNKEDYYDPDGPTCRYVLKEGEKYGERVCENMPQALALRIQDSENQLWAGGATFTKIALANKPKGPEETMSFDLDFALPGQLNNRWKPAFIAKCVKDIDITKPSLFLGENDLSAFDENKSTF
ncbi:uncharacterized protein EAE97_002131 [Botrytis byssoidea]|uniref:Uncharacterized protein n=1 Tax=Botrytis byssoidea TaxID=139641 RepID=A0A9P5IWS5_9HELO|nr:uncharacterized protein EAE97_002131 [Botrytis byssoidea]KAF7950579.1 hypothetical protein EAE97_002131 [Botrytis byssoidea]